MRVLEKGRSIVTNARLGLVLAIAACGGAAARADITNVRFYDSWGNSNGGEFQVQLKGAIPRSTGTPFQSVHSLPAGFHQYESFCLELYEHINFYDGTEATEYKGEISTHTVATDSHYSSGQHGSHTVIVNGNQQYQDELSPQTAWLYSHFIAGNLPNYHFATTTTADKNARKASADALQSAIWFLENEYDPDIHLSDLSALTQTLVGEIPNNLHSLGGVRVLVVYHNSTRTEHQDQLIMIPLPGQATMAGAGLLGLLGVGTLRRRVVR